MTVPDSETLMLPVLRLVADGQTLSAKQLRDVVAAEIGL
jgi:restriction endonuclease Mrr